MQVYWRLVALVFVLGGGGCLLIQTATRGIASERSFSCLQMIWLLLGLSVLSVCFVFPRSFYRRCLGSVLLLAYGLLWGVLFFGVKVQGARSWYRFWCFCLQPSELAKPAFLLAFAWFWQRLGTCAVWVRFAAGAAFAGLWLLPIMLQPDWGTTLIYGATVLVLLYCLGMNGRHLALAAVPALLMAGWALVCHPYVRGRFLGFLSGFWASMGGGPSSANWHVMQMRQCLVKGGWTGALFSEPSSFIYVPYRYNDSIFAAAAELLGVAGVLPLILLCLGWVGYCCYLANRHAARWTYPIYLGAAVMLSGQAFVHLAVNLGLMPATGINLPLISYGGSSLLTSLLIIGLVERCAWEDLQEEKSQGATQMAAWPLLPQTTDNLQPADAPGLLTAGPGT